MLGDKSTLQKEMDFCCLLRNILKTQSNALPYLGELFGKMNMVIPLLYRCLCKVPSHTDYTCNLLWLIG